MNDERGTFPEARAAWQQPLWVQAGAAFQVSKLLKVKLC